VGVELATHPLTARQLAVRGDDLIGQLGLEPGPIVGQLLRRLLDAVLDDPSQNERATLIQLARRWMAEQTSSAQGGDDTHHRDSGGA
jgi:hypothetical protein